MTDTAILMSRVQSEINMGSRSNLFTLRSLPVDQQHALHYEDLWGCLTRNFGKGFALGALAKVGVNGFWILLSILRGKKVPFGKAAIALLVPGSAQFGLFTGSMLSIFNSVAYLTKAIDEQSTLGRYRGAIAGALAGTSILMAPKSMRWTVMLPVLVRAVEIQLKILSQREWFPSWLNPESSGDRFIMAVASAVNIRYLAMNQGCFSSSYRKFLNKFGQCLPETLQGLDCMARGIPVDIPNLNKAFAKHKLPLLRAELSSPALYDNLENQLANCPVNPYTWYLQYPVRYLASDMLQSIPLYVPVYLLPLLLFGRRKLLRDPVSSLTRVTRSVLRSSVFLSTYCTVAINSVLMYRALGIRYRYVGGLASIGYAMSGFTAGWFSTLIEKKSRRIELALYVLSQALEALCNAAAGVHTYRAGEIVVGAVKATALKASDRVNVGVLLTFMASMAVIGHAYMRHPTTIRGFYLGILRRFFDSDERHAFFQSPKKSTKKKNIENEDELKDH